MNNKLVNAYYLALIALVIYMILVIRRREKRQNELIDMKMANEDRLTSVLAKMQMQQELSSTLKKAIDDNKTSRKTPATRVKSR